MAGFFALFAQLLTRVPALAIAIFFLSLTLILEVLMIRSHRRQRVITKAWPEVVESIQSALQSGLTVAKAFEDLANFGPKNLKNSFEAVAEGLQKGYSLADCLNWLKVELATEPSDRTIETMRLLDEVGGHTAVKVLADLAQSLRSDDAFDSELEAKQGWVVTTAKLGLIAPWVIVVMLSQRSENLAVYSSPFGTLALCTGLAICLVAYLTIQLIGVKVQVKRVFANAH